MTHPVDLTDRELLEDLTGYVFGRLGLSMAPDLWRDYVDRWLATPRGAEALDRMTLVRPSDYPEPVDP